MARARSVRGMAFDTAFAFAEEARRALEDLARRAGVEP
jgi:hypothetical protein